MGFIKNLWAKLASPSPTTPLIVLLGGGIIVGVLGWVAFNGVLSYTSTNEFCVSCHEMEWVDAEYKESIHYKNRVGVRATCADCHIPKADSVGGWVDKMVAKTVAVKDIYHHILGTYGTEEKWANGKWHLANVVWDKMRARGSKECKNCHDLEAMDFDEQGKSAVRKHKKVMAKGEKTCIDCHTGVAHKEPDEPDEEEQH